MAIEWYLEVLRNYSLFLKFYFRIEVCLHRNCKIGQFSLFPVICKVQCSRKNSNHAGIQTGWKSNAFTRTFEKLNYSAIEISSVPKWFEWQCIMIMNIKPRSWVNFWNIFVCQPNGTRIHIGDSGWVNYEKVCIQMNGLAYQTKYTNQAKPLKMPW